MDITDIFAHMLIDANKHPGEAYYIGYWAGYIAAYACNEKVRKSLIEEYNHLFFPNLCY